MNAKKAKKIRKAMMSGDPTKSGTGFTTSPSYNPQDQMLHFKFTYHAMGEKKLYKLGKQIYKKYGFLPDEKANGNQ